MRFTTILPMLLLAIGGVNADYTVCEKTGENGHCNTYTDGGEYIPGLSTNCRSVRTPSLPSFRPSSPKPTTACLYVGRVSQPLASVTETNAYFDETLRPVLARKMETGVLRKRSLLRGRGMGIAVGEWLAAYLGWGLMGVVVVPDRIPAVIPSLFPTAGAEGS
ncbi:hypothetical protein Vi05172_g116 [Venturia inaequalis]|nr:hypothetical protein Vi05172_g116 [Venturia inaequalis]